MAEALSKEQIEAVLTGLAGWSTDGRKIERTYAIPHVPGAAFIMHIAAIQDDLGHHSEATLGYRSVHVTISSSDLGGFVAEHDIELARRIEAAAEGHGAQ
ncbi:4a-hydroxytetrahydrobiopterin dehydratase [Streptomyces sp. NPDC059578]|uniref:4a-hydroxytetrahydrobiopterin dehydratase n=1 Tax=Streptomyces sp. NPDC059578 TaxID=3346874 RepID=UPI0036B45E4B